MSYISSYGDIESVFYGIMKHYLQHIVCSASICYFNMECDYAIMNVMEHCVKNTQYSEWHFQSKF